jgi:hypothetical protein
LPNHAPLTEEPALRSVATATSAESEAAADAQDAREARGGPTRH